MAAMQTRESKTAWRRVGALARARGGARGRARALVLVCVPAVWSLLAGVAAALPPASPAHPGPGATTQSAPPPSGEVARLEEEVRQLRAALDELRAEVSALRGAVERADRPAAPGIAGTASTDPATVDPAMIDLLREQVAELAQVKVESRSRQPVRLFGTILSNTVVNTDEANWLENPNIVAAPPAGVSNPASFSSTLRQSRIGLNLGTFDVGAWQASGTLILDFFGGAPAFQTGQAMGLPRLIYAFARLERGPTAIQVGQDQTLLAPRDPTSLAALSFPLLFRSGNLYLRAPQARLERSFGPVTAMGGIVAPIAGDNDGVFYRFAPLPGAGERSSRPALQSHVAYRAGDEGRRLELGASGHYAWERVGSGLDPSWAGSLDFNVEREWVGAAGEVFTGENLAGYGGALGQRARSSGGFLEARLRVAPQWSVNAGGGLDRVAAGDRAVVVRRENRSLFANTIVSLTPELKASLEYRWLESLLSTGGSRRNHHLNWVLAYEF